MSLNSVILNNSETVSLGDAYHRLKTHFGQQEGYLNTPNWGKKFREIKSAEEWERVDCEVITKVFLVALACLVLAPICIAAGYLGQDPLSILLVYFGAIDTLIAGMGLVATVAMLIRNGIVKCKHENIKPLLSEQLNQENVQEIVKHLQPE